MDGATLDEGVVVGVVVVLLGPLLPPPPQPTASTSMAAPPNSATEVLAADLIEIPNPHLNHVQLVHFSLPRHEPVQTGFDAGTSAHEMPMAHHRDGPSEGASHRRQSVRWQLRVQQNRGAWGADGPSRANGPSATKIVSADNCCYAGIYLRGNKKFSYS
ncbi:hypothetical protein AWC17_06385 [Mycobacterium nebraskense]|uniref:Uncharacterized protein n=1 Tax=Mycobacterium nebraskense TaxID=244292 RepID=A0A0F5NAM2_9MYCO|nr:hypothetical protein WU83_15355 [Mycobacterium nebraskense]KLO39777.1 hypothetical protein ABW17_18755 [Mycobacterium nebraskense]ORW21712.1 hypothetical protein AWC17_06385 [Mycobacterium nebraskense]